MRSFLVVSPDRPEAAAEATGNGAAALLLRLGTREEPARGAARDRARRFIDAARADAARALPERPQLFVEVAPAPSAALDADLAALAVPGLDGVFLEGCEGRAHVQQLSVKLSVCEARSGLAAGAVKIVALAAQTPAAVFALGGYRDASPRLVALAMDGAPLPGGEAAARTARALLALGAASAGIAALDVAPPLRGAALDDACAAARRDGFCGLVAHSAAQIAIIERMLREA